MEQTFSNLKELMDFDFSNLEAGKSNYLIILVGEEFPRVKKNQDLRKWRVVAKPREFVESRIVMEFTPRWLTISLYRVNEKSRRININRYGKDLKAIIKGIFEI